MNDYINLTPHEIVVRRDDGSDFTIRPSGEVLRVDTTSAQRGMTEDDIRINLIGPTESGLRDAYQRVRDLLRASDGTKGQTILVLSGIAQDWLGPLLSEEERMRVLSPDTSPGSAIREGGGRIVAVRALRVANR